MGDRSNIAIQSTRRRRDGVKLETPEQDRIYLYAHWSGEGVLESAVHGLKSGRVGQEDYLTRIIFEHMIQGDDGSETGFGIGLDRIMDEHELIVIQGDSNDGMTWFEDETGHKLTQPVTGAQFVLVAEHIINDIDVDEYDRYEAIIALINRIHAAMDDGKGFELEQILEGELED